ncbi:MAG: hypothetical protein Q7U04_07055 [Bacteriovorax sp.]|nr:hypothetical protein [Bacteriovorax sp.]
MNLSQEENLLASFLVNSSVNSQLRYLIEKYLEKHPSLTLNAMASRCGVPATTMRRLMQKSSESEQKSELAPHSVLSLASYLFKEKKISALLKKVDGPIAALLNKSFDQFIFDDTSSEHALESDLNAIFQDKTSYLIYKLAANQCGTTMEEIKNIFGLLGLQKLNELIEKNWILVDPKNTESFHAKEKNFSVDLGLAHQLSHSLVDFYKPRDVAAGFNLFYSLSEGMNEMGIKKIKEVEKEAVKKIYNLMNDESCQGNIAYFAVILSDVLGLTPSSQNNTGVIQ